MALPYGGKGDKEAEGEIRMSIHAEPQWRAEPAPDRAVCNGQLDLRFERVA